LSGLLDRQGVVLQASAGGDDELEAPKAWVHPNPAAEMVYVKTGSGNSRFLMFNTEGKVLIEKILYKGLNGIVVSGIPPGLYLLRVQSDQEIIYRKLIIQ
jgi:hypothetical protein